MALTPHKALPDARVHISPAQLKEMMRRIYSEYGYDVLSVNLTSAGVTLLMTETPIPASSKTDDRQAKPQDFAREARF